MDTKLSNPKDSVGTRKVPMSTVPAGVLMEIGLGMLEGAVKYGRHNYRSAGIRASVYYDAAMRHLMGWWEGEDLDPDSAAQLNHITKAITTLVVLRDAMMQDMMEDDRPPQGVRFINRLNVEAGKVIDQHADKNPKHYTIRDTIRRPVFPAPGEGLGQFIAALSPAGLICMNCSDDHDCHQRGLCVREGLK